MGRKETDHSVPAFSMPEEDFKEFETWWKGKYGSRQAAINEAIKVLMTDKVKDLLPEQAENIEDFEANIGKLLDAYRSSLERSIKADERARREVAGQLEGMATLSKTNERLEMEKAELMEKKAALEKTVSEQAEQIKRLEAELSEISYDATEADRLRKACAALTQEKADLVLKHNEEIAALQSENFARILEVVKASAK